MSARRAERPYLCQGSTRRADIIFRFFFQFFFFLARQISPLRSCSYPCTDRFWSHDKWPVQRFLCSWP